MVSGPDAEPVGHRDAMGEYVPAAGGKPLTSLSAGTPGPGDYQLPDMNVHMRTAPAHLMVGRPRERRVPAAAASAASYNTRKTKSKHNLAVTLKPRLSAPDYRCSPGPVHLVTVGDVAQRPARTSFKSLPAASATVGLPSPLDRGIVTAPAPVYDPVTAHLPAGAAFSFGVRPAVDGCSVGPGPGARDLRGPLAGPRYSLPGRPRPILPPTRHNPGPDVYDPVPVTPACHVPVIGELLRAPGPYPTPPPNAYKVPKNPTHAPQMTFRPFESEHLGQDTPGPASYTPEKPARRRAPAFSLAGPPEAEQRVAVSAGPASYKLSREPKQRPAYSFGLKSAAPFNSTPAPNVYTPHEPPGTRRGFPLVSRQPIAPPLLTPAPNAYTPRPPLPRAPRFPLGLRHLDTSGRQQEMVPSPAAYSTAPTCGCPTAARTKPGASMKGRASKYVYSGFDASKTLDTMSERADRTRKTIC